MAATVVSYRFRSSLRDVGKALGFHPLQLEQWLQQIPDNPGELLRRKFWYEQQQHQDQENTR